MRTSIEIAADINTTRGCLQSIGYINVYGKTPEELAEIEARRMDLERRLFALEKERAGYVASPTPTGE